MRKETENKKTFQIEIGQFKEMQNVITEFILVIEEILDKQEFNIQSVKINSDTNCIIVEGYTEGVAIKEEIAKEEDSDSDLEWI